MRLHPDAVDLDPISLQHFDDGPGGLALVADSLEVVVVVVQLRARVRCRGRLEGDLDVLDAQDLVEDGISVGAIVVQRLVDHVPGIALAFPVVGHGRNVRLDHGSHRVGGPRGVLDPRRELAMPYEIVASQHLPISLGHR